MTRNQICFIGLLSNADSTLLKLDIDDRFKFKSISCEEVASGSSIVGAFLRSMNIHDSDTFSMNLRAFENGNCSYIYVCSFDEKDAEQDYLASAEVAELHNHAVIDLNNKLRLMRLFKEGNILNPILYFFEIIDGVPRNTYSIRSTRYYLTGPKYTVEDHELPSLQRFLENTRLPFKDYLQLAFESFEFSYHTHKKEMAFLSLMVALEILFNRGNQELKYRISRNAGVLLGYDAEDADRIFREIKKLYDKRSTLVHTGHCSNGLTNDDIQKTRDYVRRSIKILISINNNKDDVLDILNSSGFGDAPFGEAN